jgi:hypothetical protein
MVLVEGSMEDDQNFDNVLTAASVFRKEFGDKPGKMLAFDTIN